MTNDPYAGLSPRAADVRRYFTPTPPPPRLRGPVIVWSLGLVCLLYALVTDRAAGGFLVVGIVAGAKGAHTHLTRLKRYRQARAWAEPKPADSWMDQLLYVEGRESVVGTGRARLNLVRADEAAAEQGDEGSGPLVVFGLPPVPPAGFRMAIGRDGILRATHYDIFVFFLTKWHLCMYRGLLEMETGFTVQDETKEFAYRDVVSLATASDRRTMPKPPEHNGQGQPAPGTGPGGFPAAPVLHWTTQQFFRLRVASDHISTLVGLHFEDQLGTSGFGNGEEVEMTLQRIRAKLREYTERREESGSGDAFGSHL
ncbi:MULTISPECIES: hypothetical protein [Streptomyces]|uniref:Uncharacterized protein n=1 Tax=Streptomyces lycii TaxID=2654337 RepID=A0ABQ7FF28_9ACTN|nr:MULTISPECIES: hypothetical protein [Streptomyces]KAF4405848.1 hypothetical protein GCU69_28060 [Streptomyces lycii]PGH46975.1 hypothetical protein CRI70_31085 [Streptomyces sp. Ru87]